MVDMKKVYNDLIIINLTKSFMKDIHSRYILQDYKAMKKFRLSVSSRLNEKSREIAVV